MTATHAAPRRATIAVAVLLAPPPPPSLSTAVTGDVALAAQALPYLVGALGRVSVAVIDGDAVAYAHFGASSDTVSAIGAVSKTFTALLRADAIARGEVAADTTVGALLPLGGAPAAVTLAELASHRSGLPLYLPDRPAHAQVGSTLPTIGQSNT